MARGAGMGAKFIHSVILGRRPQRKTEYANLAPLGSARARQLSADGRRDTTGNDRRSRARPPSPAPSGTRAVMAGDHRMCRVRLLIRFVDSGSEREPPLKSSSEKRKNVSGTLLLCSIETLLDRNSRKVISECRAPFRGCPPAPVPIRWSRSAQFRSRRIR